MSLKDVLHPLENLKQFYSFYFLVQESNGNNSFVSESLNDIFHTNYEYSNQNKSEKEAANDSF